MVSLRIKGWMWEGGSGWGIHVNPWLIHVNVWQKPLQYCKVISLQLIKINGKNKRLNEWGNRWNPLFIHELHQVKLCQSISGAQVTVCVGCPAGRVTENASANARDVGSTPGWGRSPRAGNGNSHQYSCLGNSTDRGLWQATIYGPAKSQTQLSARAHTVRAPRK